MHFWPSNQPFAVRERRTLGAEGIWGIWVLREVARPCNCWRFRVPREMRIKDIVAHLFDHHVIAKKNWNLERLVAWVETVEPKEVLQPEMPRAAVSREILSASDAMELRREVEEWQGVRRAFEVRHQLSRKRDRRVTT